MATVTESETYEGWTNRETWAINLHLSNNEGDYLAMCERAREIVETTEGRDSVSEMAEFIKNWTEEVFELVLNMGDERDVSPATKEARMFVSDVGSWWRANFDEIAEHWIDEAREGLNNCGTVYGMAYTEPSGRIVGDQYYVFRAPGEELVWCEAFDDLGHWAAPTPFTDIDAAFDELERRHPDALVDMLTDAEASDRDEAVAFAMGFEL